MRLPNAEGVPRIVPLLLERDAAGEDRGVEQLLLLRPGHVGILQQLRPGRPDADVLEQLVGIGRALRSDLVRAVKHPRRPRLGPSRHDDVAILEPRAGFLRFPRVVGKVGRRRLAGEDGMEDETNVWDEQKEGWLDQCDRLEDSSKQGHSDGTLGGEGGYSWHDADIVGLDWLINNK